MEMIGKMIIFRITKNIVCLSCDFLNSSILFQSLFFVLFIKLEHIILRLKQTVTPLPQAAVKGNHHRSDDTATRNRTFCILYFVNIIFYLSHIFLQHFCKHVCSSNFFQPSLIRQRINEIFS